MHVIVGAGPIGSALATGLAAQGIQVRLVTRSGKGPEVARVERVAADATDVGRLVDLAQGAKAIYNCANPAYHRWLTDWPPLAASLLQTAERTGAVLVTTSNLYGYGPVDHPMAESDPEHPKGPKGQVRVAMWAEALAAHRQGRVRATEARASDYFGPGVAGQSHGGRAIPRVLRGRPVRVFGSPDALHSWTYVPDIATTLVRLATDPRAWGRVWHVPTNAPLSQRELLTQVARIAGKGIPTVRSYTSWQLRLAGLFSPMVRELGEVRYQFDRPLVMDSSAAQATFGMHPTPMDQALRTTVESWTRG